MSILNNSEIHNEMLLVCLLTFITYMQLCASRHWWVVVLLRWIICFNSQWFLFSSFLLVAFGFLFIFVFNPFSPRFLGQMLITMSHPRPLPLNLVDCDSLKVFGQEMKWRIYHGWSSPLYHGSLCLVHHKK